VGASWRFTETAPLRLIVVSWFYGLVAADSNRSPSYERRHVAGCAELLDAEETFAQDKKQNRARASRWSRCTAQ
jgi:hypothetical protein